MFIIHAHGDRVSVFNATFNNISAISWLSVLLVEETEVMGKNHKPAEVTDKLYHKINSSECNLLVVIGTDWTTAPQSKFGVKINKFQVQQHKTLFVQIFRYPFACYSKTMRDIFLKFCMQLLCFTIQNMILEWYLYIQWKYVNI